MKNLTRLTCAGTLALAIFAAAATGAVKPQVITFVSVQASVNATNTKAVIKNKDYQGTKLVGHDTLTCVLKVSPFRCTMAVTFSTGTILGRFAAAANAVAGMGVITGGTGAYAGAKGTLAFKNLNKSGSRTKVTLTIK